MKRLVVPVRVSSRAKGVAATGEDSGDDVTTRLLKNVPAEIISTYMVLMGLLTAAPDASPMKRPAGIALVVLGAVLTPVYLRRVGGKPSREQMPQYPIATVSFVLWAYALGWPFTTFKIFGLPHESWFATLIAGAFSWIVAIVWQPKKSDAGATRAPTPNPTG